MSREDRMGHARASGPSASSQGPEMGDVEAEHAVIAAPVQRPLADRDPVSAPFGDRTSDGLPLGIVAVKPEDYLEHLARQRTNEARPNDSERLGTMLKAHGLWAAIERGEDLDVVIARHVQGLRSEPAPHCCSTEVLSHFESCPLIVELIALRQIAEAARAVVGTDEAVTERLLARVDDLRMALAEAEADQIRRELGLDDDATKAVK